MPPNSGSPHGFSHSRTPSRIRPIHSFDVQHDEGQAAEHRKEDDTGRPGGVSPCFDAPTPITMVRLEDSRKKVITVAMTIDGQK